MNSVHSQPFRLKGPKTSTDHVYIKYIKGEHCLARYYCVHVGSKSKIRLTNLVLRTEQPSAWHSTLGIVAAVRAVQRLPKVRIMKNHVFSVLLHRFRVFFGAINHFSLHLWTLDC